MNLGLLKYSLSSMRTRKMRSSLTILSVLIGITAITALISFGMGISSYVEDISQQMGNDKLMIQPRGFGFGAPVLDSNVRLDKRDVEVIEDVHGVEEATGVYMLSGEIEFHDQLKYAFVAGSDYRDHEELINEVYTLKLMEGSSLSGRERNKAVLGYNYQLEDKIFDKPVKLRDTLTVNGVEFKVAGFYEEVGNPTDDANIYINDDAAEELFGAEGYQFILVRASPDRSPTQLVEEVREDLRNHRGQKTGNEDFFVQTFEQAIATFTSVLAVVGLVVVLIAFISIVVAAVNIMNTMYAAILERTKEIGVFKALGARNKDILFVFVLEASLLSLTGGILGVGLGYVISIVAGNVVSSAGFSVFSPIFPVSLIVGSLVFAFLIGFVSGLVPAYRASKLKPVDALRYE
jgi:putative ABC transport system permease protein